VVPDESAMLSRLRVRGSEQVTKPASSGNNNNAGKVEMPRCLVVDDDSEIRTLVADYLTRFGLPAVAVADVAEMRGELERESFDVIVLDLMLPGEDGLAACQWLRTHSSIPVIMLSARGDFMSRVIGLELGADDYLAKPFELRELVARINAVLRRAVANTDGAPQRPSLVTEFNGWKFERSLRQLISPDEVVIPLSTSEYRLLSTFVDHPRRVLSRDSLLDLAKGPHTDVTDRSIDLAVSRLRQKLRDSRGTAQLIRTVRGEGYLFDAAVTS
jgi:two-component system OmpR family response regulator